MNIKTIFPCYLSLPASPWDKSCRYRPLAKIRCGTLENPGGQIGFPHLILFRTLFLFCRVTTWFTL